MTTSIFSSAVGRFLAPAMLVATALTGVVGCSTPIASAAEPYPVGEQAPVAEQAPAPTQVRVPVPYRVPVAYPVPVVVAEHHADADDRGHYGRRVDQDGWKYGSHDGARHDGDARGHADGRGAGERGDRGEHGRKG